MQDFTNLWKEQDLSSGETTRLDSAQDQFNSWLKENGFSEDALTYPEEDSPVDAPFRDPDDNTWKFEAGSADENTIFRSFFAYVQKNITAVPPHRYLLRWLLKHFGIFIGTNNFEGLWQHVENEKWRISGGNGRISPGQSLEAKLAPKEDAIAAPMNEKDFKEIITILSNRLKACFPAGIIKGAWTTWFRQLVKDPNIDRVRMLALALKWDWDTYHLFKAKVLKRRALNLLDCEEILVFISLNLAPQCGKDPLTTYQGLRHIYLVPANTRPGTNANPGSSMTGSGIIGDMLGEIMNPRGGVSTLYLDSLLSGPDKKLCRLIRTVRELNSRKVMRSPQKVFLEQWDQFMYHLSVREEYSGYDKTNKHRIFKYLYGENVERQVNNKAGNRIADLPENAGRQVNNKAGNRIADLPDSKMVRLAPDQKEYFFLDSPEFLDTRIRDSLFYPVNFTTDEVRQRNLLLTMAFLNYVYLGGLPSSYDMRVGEFSFNVTDLLNQCGFMSLHSASAYDTFLKLLLSCEDPLELFRFIWHKKTGSELYRNDSDAGQSGMVPEADSPGQASEDTQSKE